MSKTALITGASGGIGLELARIHASKGDNLVLVARSGDKLSEIKSEFEAKYNVSVRFLVRDLSVPHAAIKVYDEVTNHGIEIDYLVNNAGFGDFGLFAESDWDKQERMINLNIMALAHLTKLFLPGIISRKGRVLNVSSLAAFQPGPTMSVYFATKAFVLSFSEALNNELKDTGVTVTALCPGSTETKFHEVALGDPGKVKKNERQSAEEVALTGYRAMMKGKPVVIPGFKNSILVFASRFFTREFITRMARKIQENKNYRKL